MVGSDVVCVDGGGYVRVCDSVCRRDGRDGGLELYGDGDEFEVQHIVVYGEWYGYDGDNVVGAGYDLHSKVFELCGVLCDDGDGADVYVCASVGDLE